MKTCSACKQQIPPYEEIVAHDNKGVEGCFHQTTADCVAATEAATARKCLSIVEVRKVRATWGKEKFAADGEGVSSAMCQLAEGQLDHAMKDICTAFPKAFAQEEGR